jgi:hypothetical protein
MSTDLREELDALARTQTFSPDPSAWDRGRRARRHSRAARGAALLAVAIVVGAGAIAVRPDRQSVAPADEPGGALPSRIDYLPGDFEEDWAIGRASVALGGNGLVLIGAEDGRSHHFAVVADVLALSPDGYRVAWWSGKDLYPDRIRIADLRTGEITDVADMESASVASMTWAPDSARLRWNGWGEQGARVATWIDMAGSSQDVDAQRFGARGIPSPGYDLVALDSGDEVTAAPFERAPRPGSSRQTGIPVDRPLPADLYPDGAVVTPVGWVDEDHVVAIIDPPPSDVIERPRLAVFTSPDRPESEWTWREFLPRLPPEATSFAVDLVPDLTGDPDQELTKDFTEVSTSEDGPGRLPYVLGGLVALLAGAAFVRMMRKRA